MRVLCHDHACRAFDQALWDKTLTNWKWYTVAQLVVWVALGVVYLTDTVSSVRRMGTSAAKFCCFIFGHCTRHKSEVNS